MKHLNVTLNFLHSGYEVTTKGFRRYSDEFGAKFEPGPRVKNTNEVELDLIS